MWVDPVSGIGSRPVLLVSILSGWAVAAVADVVRDDNEDRVVDWVWLFEDKLPVPVKLLLVVVFLLGIPLLKMIKNIWIRIGALTIVC